MPVGSPTERPAESMDALDASCRAIEERLTAAGIGGDGWDALPRHDKYDRLSALVGDTRLGHLPGIDDRILTKFELDNPSGSHYDRTFLETLRSFENEGLIRPGDELRDITSGSGGISLAMLGRALGYAVRITVPDELPENRTRPMRWFGAEVVRAGSGYIKQASDFQADEIRAFKADPGWQLTRPADPDQRAFIFDDGNGRISYLNHSENLLSPLAFRAIGQEMVAQVAEPPASVFLAMGNWTSIAGISPVLREAWPDTRLIGYEGENTVNHDNFGTTVSGIPMRFRDLSLLDDAIVVTNTERDRYDALVNSHLPANEQVGHSTLMGLAAAEAELARHPGTALTIAYDQKLRY